MDIKINSMDFNGSLVNGPGLRSLLFLQGCSRKCKGCHNQSTWDPSKGQSFEVNELASIIKKNCFNGKLTITGGEPMDQAGALIELLSALDDLNICLYTANELEDVPKEVLNHLTYIKTGPYVDTLRTSTVPYVGSTNQKFIKLWEER